MSTGKSFNHKRKNHPGAFPKNTVTEEKEPGEPMNEVADFATYEAFKNRSDQEDEVVKDSE
ncbi:hypothetical protein PU629_10790 [Pullulanibacillus sp. KACC 23026]|uniref:hypothetical protein n=1 Tax=Pullulanibacillus sp. KACC 23026 TaxID=3028315 RepID=UPI0023B0731D|nr:hypothetical protein [Pullulanibacillus sp. KACC 23026]WEG14797.1 hypothetical protein PU629_10790 [Pullulanibacillus sp. KACC 23026]